ncbi:MAG: (d)CMP kinase [Acidimicrobiia bacterium]|nr:(d)CMP kinase [Acidimicrobiia bacterium]
MVVVAIDGPGGSGKSTVAKRVAAELDYAYLDTGATYRAATLAVLLADIDPDDACGVIGATSAIDIAFEDGVVLLNGADVTEAVRSDRVTGAVSAVSAVAELRSAVVELQRRWVADHGDSVVEGRDIGTVVFPDAEIKVFLTAHPSVRAQRRAGDAEAAGKEVSDIERSLVARDDADSGREVSPLRPAEDAVVLDTTDLALDEVVAAVLSEVSAGN